MFRGIGNFFHGSNPPKQNAAKQDSDYSLISMFSQNLTAFSNIKKGDPLKKVLFLDLISHFQIIFNNSNPKNLFDEETKNIFINYLDICAKYGMIIFDEDDDAIDNFFDSIVFTASLFDNVIPNAGRFFEFFCALVNKVQENPLLLTKSQILLLILFKSPQFFAQFLLNDGLCVVFSSIFLTNDKSFLKPQEMFLNIIYKSSSIETFSQVPFSNVTSFNFFLDMLKPILDEYERQNPEQRQSLINNTENSKENNKKLYLKNACIYVSLYIKAFRNSCPSLITNFNSVGGFSILNRIFIYDEDDNASSVFYKYLLEEEETDKTILSNLIDLYQNEKTNSNMRTSMISLLFTKNNDENEPGSTKYKVNPLFTTIMKMAPLSSFFKRPPFLNRKGLEYCSYLIKFYLKQNLNRASVILNQVMMIIGFPEDDQIPSDLYFQLIIDEYQIGEIKIGMLLDNHFNFINDFLLKPTVKEITSYYHHNKMSFTLLYYVYISNEAKQYKFNIIQKVVFVLNYIFDQLKNSSEKKIEIETECNQYIDFLFSLLESSFSVNICKFLLSYLEKPPIMKVLTMTLKKKVDYFDLFFQSDGFSFLTNYINKSSTNPNYSSILDLLSSLSYFYHHPQIDEWILKQPIESPLFKFPKEMMSKIAFGSDSNILHIPSFLPFCDDFDCNYEFNLYLAGKFGVPACLRIGIPIVKIPHISLIANRFITPDLIRIAFREHKKIIPEFVNIYRPHFSLYELIPRPINLTKTAPTYLNYEKQFSSASFWFRLPIIHMNDQSVTLMSVSNEILRLYVRNDILVIKTNKEKVKVPKIINTEWHNIIVTFLGKRNIINTCAIRIDNLILCDTVELKIEEQSFLPSSLTLGDSKIPNSVPIQFSKNIIISENALNSDQASKIYQNGLIHPTQKIKTTTKSQFAFEVHYLGFPSYYRTKTEIEDIFDFLDHLESIDEYKCIFNVLLNLQHLNQINFNYFWSRLYISLKRQKNLICQELPYFVHLSTKNLLEVPFRMKEINIFLSDTEIYFVFNFESIKNLLDSILNDNSIDWNCLENYDLTNSLLSIIRSGIKEEIQLLLVPILNKLLKANQTASKLKNFMNSVISMSDISNTFDMFNSMIQFDKLIKIPKSSEFWNSEVINQLLISFVESAKICVEEVYTLKQLLVLMYLYFDEKASILADLLAFYSYRNPNYLKKYPQNLVNYIFSSLSDNSKMWKAALSILTNEIKIKSHSNENKKKLLDIKRPDFLPVILSMLESLAAKCSHSIIQQKQKKNSKSFKLFSKIVNKLLNIESSQFYFLYQEKNCDKYLNSLLFLGIIPNSYLSDSIDNLNKNSNRQLKILSHFSIDPPSKSEVKDIISLITPSNLFTPINVPEKFYNEQQTIQSNSSLDFPNDLEDCQPLIEFIKESNLLELFISILFAENDTAINTSNNTNNYDNYNSNSIFNDIFDLNLIGIDDDGGENSSSDYRPRSKSLDAISSSSNSFSLRYFERYLLDFLNGTALMYLNYWKEIANLLIFKILNRIYSSNLPNSINYLKSTFEGIHKCIIPGVFAENYLDLMELVFLIFKKGEFTIDQFLNDDKYLEYYREFLLMVFHFSPLKKKDYKYDKNTKDPIFDILMRNKDFVFTKTIFNDNKFASLWLHASRIYNQAMSANLSTENETNSPKNEDKSTDPGICCMSFLLAVIDNSVVSSYDPALNEDLWNSFLSRDLFDSQDVESKINKMNSIIEMKQNIKIKAAEIELISHIYRAVNLSVEQNLTFYKINIRQRQNERMMFLHNQIARKRRLANANVTSSLSKNDNDYIRSFHLSPLSYPIHQSRAITPSPYRIKSPPSSSSSSSLQEGERVSQHLSKSDYALSYFICKERIKVIEKCGLLNCSPEWCFFNSNDNDYKEFSSVFEYSQIIEQGPPSTLSLFEDAFEEYFTTSSNSNSLISLSLNSLTSLSSLSSLPTLQSVNSTQSYNTPRTKKLNYLMFDVSFLYYIHTIPSVLFLTDNYLLIVILAKGALQLISRTENPVAFLPFSENVALGEYNSKVSMFCGHAVISIKYDQILRMNNHLYIHKNVGLIISSFHATDIILVFNSTNEMRQANNFIVSKRLQKEQLSQKKKNKQTEIQQLNQQFNTGQPKDHISKSKTMINPPLISAQGSLSGFSLSLNLNSYFLNLNQVQLFPPSQSLLLFNVESLSSASLLWKNNIISNFDYLLLLNSFGGRSFLDLSQYPVVPWIAKPDAKNAGEDKNQNNFNEDGKKENKNSENATNKDETSMNNNNNVKPDENQSNESEKLNLDQDQINKNKQIKDNEQINENKQIKDNEQINENKQIKDNEQINENKQINESEQVKEIEQSNESEQVKDDDQYNYNFNSILFDPNEDESENEEEEEDFKNADEKEIEFQMRNLALPMGQLSKKRSRHFDQTYELSAPMKYFYGFHYSLPGAVFWLLMRTPPFTFFLWDLNDGWDNSQRLFVSLSDAYNSAAMTNPSDLKELVPALYQVPESLTNVSNIELNVSNDNVILPAWSNDNPFFFTETYLKLLNASNQIQKWIDLIFGYKQNGDVAIEFKNLFLPSSYHTSCADDLEMDQESYNSQVLNFGQCPIQLFKRAHQFKLTRAISHSNSLFGCKSTSFARKKRRTEELPSYRVSEFRFVSSAPAHADDNYHPMHPYPMTPVPSYKKSSSPFGPSSLKVNTSFNERKKTVRSQNNSPVPSFLTSKNQIFRGCSNFFSWEMKDILSSGELINPLNLKSFMAAPIGEIYIALPKDAAFYPLKCSGSTFFFIIDKKLESISFIRMSESMEIVFVKFSSEFAFANHLAVSDDGMFIAISFSFGRVDVYRVVFDETLLEKDNENENSNGSFISNFIKNINTNSSFFTSSSSKTAFLSVGCPKGIVKFGSYSNRAMFDNDQALYSSFSCHMSALLPQDFICASAFDDGSVILWNFATETRHRVLWPYNDLVISASNANDHFEQNEINSFYSSQKGSVSSSTHKEEANKQNLIRHSMIPVSLVFDAFNAVLTVAFSFGIIQYSINGSILRDYTISNPHQFESNHPDRNSIHDSLLEEDEDTIEIESNFEIELDNKIQREISNIHKSRSSYQFTDFNQPVQVSITSIGVLGLDFMFDKRLLIVGLSDGSLRLLSVSPTNYSFVEAGTINAHGSPVSSILCQIQMMRIITVDMCGISRLIDFSVSLDQTSVVVRCSFCDNPQSTICKMCQMPICSGCIVNGTGLCRSCFLK